MGKFFLTLVFSLFWGWAAWAAPLQIASSLPEKLNTVISREFLRSSGLQMEMVALPEGDFSSRLNFIYRNRFDGVIGMGEEELYLMEELKLLVPYLSPAILTVPERFRSYEGEWTPVWIDHLAFLSNANNLARLGLYAPDKWIELLSPRLVGEMIFVLPRLDNCTYASMISLWEMKGTVSAWHYANALHKLDLAHGADLVSVVDAVVKGNKTVTVVPLSMAMQLENDYQQLYATIISDANINLLKCAAILRGTADLPGMEKFMDFLLSDRFKEAVFEGEFEYWWHVGNKRALANLQIITGKLSVIHRDVLWSAKNFKNNVKKWQEQ